MVKQFKNFDELAKYVNQQSKKTLQQKESNVKNVVVHELRESIRENVYEKYDSPAKNPYQRQMDNGGLTDIDNFEVESTADGVAIYSTREGKDREGDRVYVAEIIEGYKEYSVEDVWDYGFEEPRPFVEPARESLRKGNMLEKAFSLDMKNSGFDVR